MKGYFTKSNNNTPVVLGAAFENSFVIEKSVTPRVRDNFVEDEKLDP